MSTLAARRNAIRRRDPADILLRRMAAKPEVGRERLIRDTIGRLIEAGIWPRLDALWILHAHSEQAALLNWRAPRYDLTNVGMAFTADSGVAGNGVDAYLDTNLWLGTAGMRYVQDSAHFMLWSLTADLSDNRDGGGVSGQQLLFITCASATGTMQWRINDASGDSRATGGVGDGMFVADRPDAATKRAYRNGALLGTEQARASTGIPALGSQTPRIGGFDKVTYSARGFAAAGLGASLGATMQADYHTILSAFFAGAA